MKKLINFIFALSVAVIMFSFSASAATAGQVVTEQGNLNLRKSPSATAEVLTSVKRGSWLTLEEKTGDWYRVKYDGNKTAYASAKYIRNYTASVEAVVNIASGVLNVRSGADTSYGIRDTLAKGEKVIIARSNENWAGVVYRGNKAGYASKKYLKAVTGESYPAVKLSVPSFKQYDARWKNYPIGTTGGTIGTIGCLTTAIAMTESYVSSYSITPDKMAKKLSYSSSGSLYWPSDYVRLSAGGAYLEEVYGLLKKGKPVIFGATKTSGGQHWVVVYGYEGSGSLSAGNFLIHDPGSQTRTTLQSFFNAYPVAERYVYKK